MYMCAVYKYVWSISNMCDVYMPIFNVIWIWTCDYKVCLCVLCVVYVHVCVYVLYVCAEYVYVYGMHLVYVHI